MTTFDDHRLKIDVGIATDKGRRPDNQDFAAAGRPPSHRLIHRGYVGAIADGIGGAAGGRVAAESAVRGFLDGYYGLPPTLGPAQAAGRALDAVNGWIAAQGRVDPQLAGMGTTFTALLISRRAGHVLHVGDTRLYRFRDDVIERLTVDHVQGRGDLRHGLTRAIGLDSGLRIDHATFATRVHDRYLLCCDGVHDSLSDARLSQMMGAREAPQKTAEAIIEAALASGSGDNVTALVVDIIDLPAADALELSRDMEAVPIRELPETGETVDGFTLEGILSEGRYSRIVLGRDTETGAHVVLKFPHPRVADDMTYRRAFVSEAWVAARVRSPWIGEVIEIPEGRRTRLYSVMPYYEGETLEQRLNRNPPVSFDEGALIAGRLARALATLHRAGVIHRDVKPDNIILTRDGGQRLIDLGVCRTPQLEDMAIAAPPGTPSYMAPELFAGGAGDESSDLFAFGVTLYRLFSRSYPYGEIEPFSHPRFGDPTPLARYRPDLPPWLDAAVARAIAVNRTERYQDVLEFAFEIENGAGPSPPAATRRRPLMERNPTLFWQIVSAILFLCLMASMARR